MKSHEQTWFIEPVAKGRPRFTRTGHAFTDKKTRDYEKTIREGYIGGKFEGPIGVSLTFGMPIPKSTSKRNREKMIEKKLLPCVKIKDVDNCMKSVLDALNGIAYEDDSQIVYLMGRKVYAAEPHVYIKIWEFE